MTKTSGQAGAHTALSKKGVAAVIVGNWLEFYDFIVYTFFAVMIGKTFFPAGGDETLSLLASLATFGAGFFTRPLGAAIIGAYADRAGRKAALTLTLLLMGVGTAMMALTPGYNDIGIAAPILLVIARLIQGFSCGGEVGPATTYLLESAPPERRARMTSWQGISQQFASIMGAGFGFILATTLTEADLYEWGWRIPFLLGIVVAPVGIYIRRHLPETLHAAEAHASTGAVLKTLVTRHSKALILGIFIICGGTISTYVFNYMTTFAITTLHFDAQIGTAITLTGSVISIAGIVLGAWIADRFGTKPLYVITRALFIAACYPAFMLMTGDGSTPMLVIGLNMGLNFLFALGLGGIYALLPEAFPQAVRSSGLSILYASAVTIFGGTTQFVVAWLIDLTGDPLVPAWYQMGANALSIVAVILIVPFVEKRHAPTEAELEAEEAQSVA